MNFQLNKELICWFFRAKTNRPQVEWCLNYDLTDISSISARTHLKKKKKKKKS